MFLVIDLDHLTPSGMHRIKWGWVGRMPEPLVSTGRSRDYSDSTARNLTNAFTQRQAEVTEGKGI